MNTNVNNYRFSEILGTFKQKILDPHKEKTLKAEAIMNDPTYKWRDDAQKKAGEEQLKLYNIWLQFYETVLKEGNDLCFQHENLVNKMSKLYDNWYENISNEGKQETEIMSMQADMLCEIFGEIYKELAPLKLEGMKPPKGLNL
jgi:hypothetical protein